MSCRCTWCINFFRTVDRDRLYEIELTNNCFWGDPFIKTVTETLADSPDACPEMGPALFSRAGASMRQERAWLYRADQISDEVLKFRGEAQISRSDCFRITYRGDEIYNGEFEAR